MDTTFNIQRVSYQTMVTDQCCISNYRRCSVTLMLPYNEVDSVMYDTMYIEIKTKKNNELLYCSVLVFY